MVDTPKHSVSVAAVIIDAGRALLVRRRDNSHWEPPGGVLELGETIEDGLRREVREEIGLDIEPVALSGVYKNMARGIVALVFRCKLPASNWHLTASDEAEAFHWADQSEVAELADEAYAVRILDAMAADQHPAIRAHDGVRVLGHQ